MLTGQLYGLPGLKKATSHPLLGALISKVYLDLAAIGAIRGLSGVGPSGVTVSASCNRFRTDPTSQVTLL